HDTSCFALPFNILITEFLSALKIPSLHPFLHCSTMETISITIKCLWWAWLNVPPKPITADLTPPSGYTYIPETIPGMQYFRAPRRSRSLDPFITRNSIYKPKRRAASPPVARPLRSTKGKPRVRRVSERPAPHNARGSHQDLGAVAPSNERRGRGRQLLPRTESPSRESIHALPSDLPPLYDEYYLPPDSLPPYSPLSPTSPHAQFRTSLRDIAPQHLGQRPARKTVNKWVIKTKIGRDGEVYTVQELEPVGVRQRPRCSSTVASGSGVLRSN
ncbi:hypothetical protein DFP72DRAFT_1143377, partial [Ephemerocybe angulata]